MLHQKRSGSLARLKYLVAVPIGAGLLCASTMAFSKTYGWIDLAPKKAPKKSVANNARPASITQQPVVKPVKIPTYLPDNFKPQKTSISSKGYKIEEGFYSVGKNTYYVAIINPKKGKKLSFTNDKTHKKLIIYKGAGNESGDEMIYNNYGYKFPDVKVTKLDVPPAPGAPEPPKPKTDQVRFPPPIVRQQLQPISERNFKAFAGLREYLAKNIQYPDAAREKKISGVTTAKFDVDDNGNIIGSSIDISGTNDFNEAILAGLNTYSGKISVKKGSYNIVFTFRAGKNDQLKFPPTTSSNGSFAGIINIATEKSFLVDVVRFPPPEPPKPKVDQIKFPPPIVRPDKAGQLKRKELPPPPEPPKPKVADYKGPYFKTFDGLRAYLAKNIKYPKSAKEQDITKTVTATFNINAEGQISNPAISYNSGEYFDEEILKALNAYTNKIAVKADTYSMIFQFNIVKKNGPNKFPPPVVLTPGLAGVITITAYAE